MSKVLTAVVALVVGIVIGAAVVTAQPKLGGVTIEDEAFLADVSVGDDLSVGGDLAVVGAVTGDLKTVALTGAATLTAAQSGTTFVIKTTGATYTLPAVSNTGWNARFVVGAAFDTANAIIDSAEGDNVEGTLIVAGAVVDCAAVDQINFISDGENIGDYVEVYSDGTQWLIGDSGVLSSAKMTCTDPS